MDLPAENNDRQQNGDSSIFDSHARKKLKPSPPIPISPPEIDSEFAHHDPRVARLNNGSFGSCPASILSAQSSYRNLYLRQPDEYYFHHLKPLILRSRLAIKGLINADDVDEISIVDNATTAAAIVLQRVGRAFSEGLFRRGDAVVMLHCAYGAIKKSIEAYVSRAGGHVIEVSLPFPVRSDEEIIIEFRKALDRGMAHGRKVRLAVIDHITSMPSVLIPVKELTRICREQGVDQVFVDAAHAIGNVDVDMKDIGADFYASNLHKWFFTPPSAAFLYCRKVGLKMNSEDSDLHHPVVSHEYGNGLAVESAWIGTRDYSAQLVVPEAIEFVNRFEGGIEGIRKRNHKAVVEMGNMLATSWGTDLGTAPEMATSMIMVGLPTSLKILSDEDAMKLRTHLRKNFGIEVPIYYQAQRDKGAALHNADGCVTGYARISHQVYNKVDDYHRFRDAINKLVSEGFSCGMLPSD